MWERVLFKIIFSVVGFVFFLFVFSSSTCAAWYDSDWQYRKAITIDKDKVSSTDQTNFPLLVSVTLPDFKDTDNNGRVGQADGGDILFTSSNGSTKLSHEIETYINTTGNLVAWVKIPSLSASVNTTIYIYYGNASVDNQWVIDGSVWDGNYAMVQHLNDSTTSVTSDSTANVNTGNKKGAAEPVVSSSGKISNAQDFDGSDDYINVGNKANLNITDSLTIEMWVKPDAGFGETAPRLFDKSKYVINITPATGIPSYFLSIGSANKTLSALNALSTTDWNYLVITFDSSLGSNQQKIYMSGDLNNQRDQEGTIDDSSANNGFIGDIGNTLRAYNGKIDELRVSNTARSADWIKTSYNNQNDPSSFYFIGTLECSTTCPSPSSTIYQILSTGQSLALGSHGSPALTATQPYSNKELDGYFFTDLIESTQETISSAMANTITALDSGNDYQTAVSIHAVSGLTYLELKQGTDPYSNGLAQATNAKRAAEALNMNEKVIAVTAIHGEADRSGAFGVYKDYLVEWQDDYNTDVKAITGQIEDIPLFTDQMGSYTAVRATSYVPIDQLAASEENPTKIYLVGPKYFLTYSPDDGIHLTNTSYRWLGEYYGKVIKKVAVDRQSWTPLSPRQIVRNGSLIYARFNVPASPIVFDITNVLEKTSYGFEYADDGSPPAISSVEIFDSETVKITLASTPSGANQKLRYAYTGTIGAYAGADQAGSARGNLRDSDATSSLYGNNLYNWAVHFDKTVTEDSAAPVNSSVSASVGSTTATVSWTSDEAGSSVVDYGLTNSYGSSTTETDTPIRVTSHSKSLTNLASCTTYHYRVRSKDLAQNQGTSSDSTFTTSGCVGSATVDSQTTSDITTTAGGSVNLLSGQTGLTLTIPASFSGSNANFQIKQLDKTATINTTSVPTGYSTIGSYIYDLKALSGVSTTISAFNKPITVTLTYGASDVVGISESSLVIYRYDGSNWDALSGCNVSTTTKTVTCTTTAFSVFGLFGQANSGTSSSSSTSSVVSANAPPGCGDILPGPKASWLYGGIAQNAGSVLLYFTAADNPVSKYVLQYGEKSGEYPYGLLNLGVNSWEPMTFLVRSLTPGTTYYFRVRGDNGCAVGTWSNEIAVKTKPIIAFNQLEIADLQLVPKSDNDKCVNYVIKDGDSLWSIARELLGDGGRYQEIVEQNEQITDANRLKVGWKLKLNCQNYRQEMKIPNPNGEAKENAYEIKIRIADTNNEPVVGAKVTIHSEIHEALTDENGVVEFVNVEPGEHRVLVAYKDYEGEQSVNLAGEVRQIELSITVEQKKVLFSPLLGVILMMIMTMGVVILRLVRVRTRREK